LCVFRAPLILYVFFNFLSVTGTTGTATIVWVKKAVSYETAINIHNSRATVTSMIHLKSILEY
jgi:hypothetical protein